MNFDIQCPLENEQVILYPLQEQDFEDLYAISADPKIWEQHPNKDRWKKKYSKLSLTAPCSAKVHSKLLTKTKGL